MLFSRHLRNAACVGKETVHLADFQGVADALIHSRQRDRVASLLMTDISSNHCPYAGRINIRNVREVKDKTRRAVGTYHVLKFVKGGDCQRPGKPENASVILQSKILDI